MMTMHKPPRSLKIHEVQCAISETFKKLPSDLSKKMCIGFACKLIFCLKNFQVGVFRNALPDALKEDERERWTESYVKWSPQGSYMTTFHSKGIALWGGPGFQKIARLAHPGVQFIDFSPCEKYIVTFSPNIDPR